jgi:hypothetical protein
MAEKIKKYLKIAFYTFLIFSLLIFIFGFLIFSNPLFMNLFANSLIKFNDIDSGTVNFQAYSKEAFAAEFFNTSLTPKDDFIKLFESHYGTENKKERIFMITYDIQDPNDKSRYTIYGINKYMDLVYKNTRQLDLSDPKHKRIKLHRSEDKQQAREKDFK